MVSTTTETLLDAKANAPIPPLTISSLHILLLLGIPLIWFLSLQRRARNLALNQPAPHTLAELEQPWQTNDWATLFGLIGLSNDHRWSHIPLWLYHSIQHRWHQPSRPWLKRLLAMGVIPLYIQDGGIPQHRVNINTFGRRRRFPWFTYPLYQQGKKRAYFEFVVPYPRETREMMNFLNGIISNRIADGMADEPVVRDNSYGVTVRFSPPERGPIYYSIDNPPCRADRPIEVGAKSGMEPLLPFKADRVLKGGFGERCNALAQFMRDFDSSKIPLLRHADDTIVVRVEAKHYGVCELDQFVFGVAQDVGLPVLWPEVECRNAALEELERRGLSTDGLRPFMLSEPADYH
ncbi:hypothetical protein EK21DRAFT_66837 [Setomelanomma holmii]|uniref:Uncharacterized protein n=1 Tax=Setomelanomma holmii TaxID=210430 RepID=A0A9P4LLH2_9PLEO|nr:hypothetical protein EK21DRAFT_66837 [Setomelanomma holmii]